MTGIQLTESGDVLEQPVDSPAAVFVGQIPLPDFAPEVLRSDSEQRDSEH